MKLRRERDELHLQYAREIEAAHAKIGAREEQLMMQHRSQINEMEQLHDKGEHITYRILWTFYL